MSPITTAFDGAVTSLALKRQCDRAAARSRHLVVVAREYAGLLARTPSSFGGRHSVLAQARGADYASRTRWYPTSSARQRLVRPADAGLRVRRAGRSRQLRTRSGPARPPGRP